MPLLSADRAPQTHHGLRKTGQFLAKLTLQNKDVQLVYAAVDGTKTPLLSALAPATPIASEAKWICPPRLIGD